MRNSTAILVIALFAVYLVVMMFTCNELKAQERKVNQNIVLTYTDKGFIVEQFNDTIFCEAIEYEKVSSFAIKKVSYIVREYKSPIPPFPQYPYKWKDNFGIYYNIRMYKQVGRWYFINE